MSSIIQIKRSSANTIPRACILGSLLTPGQKVRDQRHAILQESDVIVIRNTEDGLPVSQEVKDYRQALRDVTTQTNPFDITWPVKPTGV